MSQSPRSAIIAAAVALLRAGTLPSSLPRRLMEDYGLSSKAAAELSLTAVRRWRAETKPGNARANGGRADDLLHPSR